MAWINKKRKASKVRKTPDEERKERHRVYTSASWRKLSDLKRRSDPLCEVCLMRGKVVPGEDVHHLRSFTKMEGNEKIDAIHDYDNLITLCKACHRDIHHGALKGVFDFESLKLKVESLKGI